jgi:hypothetical protein
MLLPYSALVDVHLIFLFPTQNELISQVILEV